MVKAVGVVGVILAGGRSSRFNLDPKSPSVSKAKRLLADKPLIEHVIERLNPQVDQLIINNSDDTGWFQQFSVPIVADKTSANQGSFYPGPLVGLASTMDYLVESDSVLQSVMVVPCDGPFIPDNLVTILQQALITESADVACIRFKGELQPTFSLWQRRTHSNITAELATGKGGFKKLLSSLNVAVVDWPDEYLVLDPFFNINTPQDLQNAERLYSQHQQVTALCL